MDELITQLRNAFKVQNDIVTYGEIERDILDGINIGGTNLIILIVAIFIASIGLNTDSTAVVIGAMLISPLMGNIIAIGYGISVGDYSITKRGLIGFGFQVIFSIVASAIYFVLTPYDHAGSELLARTSPTLFDLLIAVFGGVAAIVGIARKSKGNVIPGVAIATALMPPLCTAGYGIGTANSSYFLGAIYLFSMNAIYIIVATIIVSKIMRLPSKIYETDYERRKKLRNTIIAAGIAAIPSVYMGMSIVRENNLQSQISSYVAEVFEFPDTQVVYSYSDLDNMDVEIALLGTSIDQSEIDNLVSQKDQYGLTGFTILVTQVEVPEGVSQQQLDDILNNAADSQTQVDTKVALNEQQIAALSAQLTQLETELEIYQSDNDGIAALNNEIMALYPELTNVEVVVNSNDLVDTITVTLVGIASWSEDQMNQVESYLAARLGDISYEIVYE